MVSKVTKDQEPIPYQALLDENNALRDEIQSLRARLEEPEELQRAISEGDLDALVMPVSEEDMMVFTLNNADQAYRILMETANEDVLIVDAEFKITYAGKRLIDKLGYSQEEVIGRSWLDFVDEESKVYSELRMEMRRQDSDENYELKLIRQDGSPLWILASSKPLFDENSKFKGALAMLTDITERKRSDEALRESEEKFRNLFNLMGEAIQLCELVLDEEGRPVDNIILDVNLAYETNSGFRREKVIGRRIKEVLPIVEQVWLDRYGEVVRTGTGMHFEEYNSSLDKWFEVFASPIDGNRFATVFNDITERKRAEEVLQKQADLIDLSPDGIITRQLDGTITFWSKGAQLLYGWTSQEAIGQQTHKLLKTQFSQPLEQMIEQVQQTGYWSGELTHFTKDGRQVVVQSRWQARLGDQNNVREIMESNVDITERKRAEEKLTAALSLIQSIIDNTPDIVYAFDLEERFVLANIAVANLLNSTPDRMIGKRRHEFMPKMDADWHEANDRQVFEVGRVLEFEEYSYLEDRSITWLTKKFPLRDAQGRISAVAGISADITERNQAAEKLLKAYERIQIQSEDLQVFNEELQAQSEELQETNQALQESEKRFRTLAENSPDMITRFDRQNCHTYANPAALEVYGLSQEEIVGKTYGELRRDPEQVRFWETYYEIVFATGKTETLEFQYTSPTGKEYSFSTSIVPEFVNGKVTSILTISHDITAIKQAEAKLKETLDNLEELVKERTAELEKAYNSLKYSERSLAEAQKMAHVGNWEWDLVTNELRWSDETYRIFGFKPNEFEMTYNSFLSNVYSDDREYVDNAIKRALKGERYSIEFRIVSADGVERIVHEEGEVAFDEKNTPIRMIGTIQDITERKRTEKALNESETRLRRFYDSGMIGALYYKMDGSITKANDKFLEMVGYTREDLQTGSIKWDKMTPPEYRSLEEHAIAELKATGVAMPYEKEYIRKDGSRIPIILGVANIDEACDDGIAFVLDITERKKAEEEVKILANAVESSNDAIVTESLEGIITSWNKGAEQIYGYSAEEIMGKDISILEPANLRGEVRQLIEKVKQGKKIRHYDTLRLKKDGTLINVSITFSPIFNSSGELVAFSAIVRDITERIKAEKALEKIEKIRIKEIHHRIKNNLQVISSLLDLQAEKFKDENVRAAFREGQNRVISMSLIHEELYKGEGTDTLDFSAYLQTLAENLFQTYSLNSKNIHLCTYLEESAFFDMDTAVPLGIIVNELISNSLKHAFNESKEGEIRVQFCREEKNNEMHNSIFSLTISDNGIGIPEYLELESVESLGLQLVSILVDQLDGEIELERRNGTEFTMRFSVTKNA